MCMISKAAKMAKSSELKSELLEQMKLHLSSDAGKHLTKKIGLVYQFNIAPKKIGFNEDIYVVDLKKGEVRKGPYEDEKPDAIFSFTDEDFFKIASWQMHPLIAFMSHSNYFWDGCTFAMNVEGSLSAAQKFTPVIFPKPSKIAYGASQIASQKETRSSPANGQSFATQKDDYSEEALDDISLETTVMQMMHPRCRSCCIWLRELPNDWNQPANNYSTRSSTTNGQSFVAQKDDFSEEALDDDSLETAVMRRMCSRCRLSYKWLRGLRGLMSSWVSGVPNWFVWQKNFEGLDMGRVITIRTQRRNIQKKYPGDQNDMKKSGENSSLAQSKGQAEEKESPKLASQIKRSANREQLAKVHAELRAKERASLTGLKKALMESENETDEDGELGSKKVLTKEDMFEAFTVEQTFLGGKPTEATILKEPASIEVSECNMEKASQASDQT
ncbi:uncharacterized protein LOC114258294 isoform X2 [Camellia sinensis]|uniref:uncharacterized protein LOC114258294 isoform X2 n=1 Tax=Camellia sinensis TaxID=4442 RepID=UPI00103638A6|nr:uncharacterized protein LOC114258294 isoform X2 [Camellia sinensis]